MARCLEGHTSGTDHTSWVGCALLLLLAAGCSCGAQSSSEEAARNNGNSRAGTGTSDSTDSEPSGPVVEHFENGDDQDNDLFPEELAAREEFLNTEIALAGNVTDLAGRPIEGALVEVGDDSGVTSADGSFTIEGLFRENTHVTVSAAGYKSSSSYAHLQQAVSTDTARALPITLTEDNESTVRLLFGGDTSFGRRFVDTAEVAGPLELPRSDAAALIDAADPLPGARRAVSYVRPWFADADFPVLNFESPITGTPSEYHETKEFIFYTLPETLGALPSLGVEYVSLGNNHVYDYLEDGVLDTMAALQSYDIASSGAGLSPGDAFAPYRRQLAAHDYSFVSMSSVSGSQNPPLYVAANDPQKGGSADLRDDDAVATTLKKERAAGFLPIAQLHTGKEYTYWPSDFARERMSYAAQNGAALVIGHHPHVAQGFIYEDGVLIAASLGNFCFDQARLETMLGLLAQVDMDGARVVAAHGIPVYLEDYRPRPVVGELAEHLLRRIGEVSENAALVINNGVGRVLSDEEPMVAETRTEPVTVDFDAEGSAIVDLRALRRPGETLLDARADSDVSAQAGQDILLYGDFEDWDVDEQHFELARWDVTGGSTFPCLSHAKRGTAALCSVRSGSNESNSVVAFRNRIRVLGEELDAPNKDLTLLGYARGDNAGEMWLEVEYYASVGSAEFGREEVWRRGAGSYDWHVFSADLNMAADIPGTDPLKDNPHALRFFYFQEPPADGDGVARLDDLAVISWRPAVDLADGLDLVQPNPIDFLRLWSGRSSAELMLTWYRHDVAPE